MITPTRLSAALCAAAWFLYALTAELRKLVFTDLNTAPLPFRLFLQYSYWPVYFLLAVLAVREAVIVLRMGSVLYRNRREKRALSDAQRESVHHYLRYAALGLAAFLLMNLDMSTFHLPLLIYFSKELSLKRRMKTCLSAYVLLSALWAVLYSLGMLADSSFSFTYGAFHSFGFDHPNTVARMLFFLFMLWWYLYGQSRKRLSLVFAASVMVLSWFLFGCRTVIILMILFIAMNILSPCGERILRENKRVRRGFSAAFTAMPLTALIVTALAGMYFDIAGTGSAMYFSRRFHEFMLAFRGFGLSLGPRDLNELTSYYFYFDNTYCWLLFCKGLLYFMVVIVWMYLADHQILRRRDRGMAVIAILLTLYSLTERMPMKPLFLLYLSCISFFATDDNGSYSLPTGRAVSVPAAAGGPADEEGP